MTGHSGPKIEHDGLLFALDGASNKFTGKDENILAVWPWSVGTGSATGFGQNGDGNSRILDTNPHGARDVVWDVSNQDATSNADGGWNGNKFAIDNTKMYRFSVWIRRNTIGNGSTYFGLHGYNSSGSNTGVTRRDNGGANQTNPYFWSGGWSGAGTWKLLVAHVWPVGSGTGSNHPDSGFYDVNGNKIGNISRDYVWQAETVKAHHRSYLYYSTNTSTNQQFWDPRVEIVDTPDTKAPSIRRLARNVNSRWNLVKKVSETVISPQKVYLNPTTNSFVFGPDDNDKTIRVPLAQNFNKLEGTISAWIKPYGYASSNGIFVNRDDATANAADWLWLGTWSSGSILYFRIGNGSACCSNDLTISSFSTNHAPTNTWTHIAASWKSGGLSYIYINGKQVATRAISSIPSTNPSTYGRIGLGHSSGTTGSWNGEIAKFTINNKQMSANQIRLNFIATKARFGI